MKATVYIATSLDGFIARKNGALDWLPHGDEAVDAEDYGYQAFIDSVDGIVMGRNTYELVATFEPWPYGEKPVIVLSSQRGNIPDPLAQTVEVMTATPTEVIHRLAERGFQHIYVDGGKTIQGFLYEGLIQTLMITRVPILLGEGIPLFGALSQDVRLHHLKTRQFANGLVQSQYEVIGTPRNPSDP